MTSVDRRSSLIVDCGEISDDLLLLLFLPVPWYQVLLPGTRAPVPNTCSYCCIHISHTGISYLYTNTVVPGIFLWEFMGQSGLKDAVDCWIACLLKAFM